MIIRRKTPPPSGLEQREFARADYVGLDQVGQDKLRKQRSELARKLWEERSAINKKYQNKVNNILSSKEKDLKFINNPVNSEIYDRWNKGYALNTGERVVLDNYHKAISNLDYNGYNNQLNFAKSKRNDSYRNALSEISEDKQEFRDRALKETRYRQQQAIDAKIDTERAAKKKAQQEAFEKSQREAAEKAEKFNKSAKGKLLNWVSKNPKTVKGIGIGALGLGTAGIGYSVYKHNKNKKEN